MTFEQAVKVIEDYEHLIGQEFDEREISDLIIVPSNRKYDGEIASRVYRQKQYDDILSKYNDFTVIVLFDLDEYGNTGIIICDDLENVIKSI